MIHNSLRLTVLLASFPFVILNSRPAAAGWPLNGTPVSAAPGSQYEPEAVSDGQGGIIIVWQDLRNGDPDIYAQRLDGWGNELWTAGGVQVSSGNSQEQTPRLASDGSGGAIIAWEHAVLDYDIRAQRIDASGSPLWQPNGVPVCALISSQQEPRLIPDGSGGAVIAWHDTRLGDWDVFAQRVDASGARLWTPDGVGVCTQASDQFRPQLASDSFGGVFIVWEDTRNSFQYDIYTQRIGPGGSPYLVAGGVPVCSNGVNQLNPRIVSLDIGGAVVVWEDYRTGAFSPATFAQRITSAGGMAWTADGIQACTFGGPEYSPQVVNDDDHGVIVCWQDMRALGDIYAQRLDAFGTRLWAAVGVSLTGPGQQIVPRMTSDGNGGAIISWRDLRYSPDGDVYAGHIDAAGVPVGVTNGTPITSLPGLRFHAPIVSDGQGGAIMAWEDYRTADARIYAQRVDRYDNWGYPSADIVAASDVPGDQGGQVNVAWTASRLDPWPVQYIDRYTVWRALDPALALAILAAGEAPLISAAAVGPEPKGIRVEMIAGAAGYWQLIASVDAYHLESYGYAAPTLFDSTLATPNAHHFQIIAHHDVGNEYWISRPVSGRSIDNLAPAAPLLLIAQRVGSDVLLTWNPSGENEPDFSAYAVYRASSTGVQPLPQSFLADAPDTLLTDPNPPPGFLYYIVTAKDTHGNQSAPSNEATVAIPTGIDDRAPSLTRLTLGGNFPNPFNAATSLRVGLPRASDIRLEVYDVAGRRVASYAVPRAASGWHDVAFDGKDARGNPLPSGVYFYRVTAAGDARTHKMVVRR